MFPKMSGQHLSPDSCKIFVLVIRTKISFLSNFQLYNTVSVIVTLLYITSI